MPELKTIVKNRKAYHDYFVEESMEAGIELVGTEVKSLRQGNANLKDSWCDLVGGEVFLKQMHISPYEKGNIFNRDPVRPRKILLHRREITRLAALIATKGVTLIPLSIYFKGSRIKVQVGVCRGKKLYDKREDLAKKAAQRDIDRAMKERGRE